MDTRMYACVFVHVCVVYAGVFQVWAAVEKSLTS